MKVKFDYGIASMSGTLNKGVFYMSKLRNFGIMRVWVKPTETAQNALLGSIAKNLAILYHGAAPGYLQNLRDYAAAYYSTQPSGDLMDPARGAFAIYMKLMWAWQASDPEHVELTSITSEDIETIGINVLTIKSSVENNYIPSVPNFNDYDTPMYS